MTVLTSDHPADSVYAQAVTFTATVSATAAGAGTPTGLVQFLIGGTDAGAPVTLSGGTATITVSTLSAGSPAVTAVYTSGSSAFANSQTSGPFSQSVTPATLTVTANNATRVYGAADPTFTDIITGFVNGDSASVLSGAASLTTAATAASSVGTYPVAAALGSLSAANYTFAFVNGALTVTPAPLTVTADNQSKVYGAGLPPLTAHYTGFVNGDTASRLATAPTVTTTATAASGVGTYAIAASGAVDPNYTIAFVAGTLTITPAPLTITADNQTTVAGTALPTLTVHDAGFVNGDSAASLVSPPVVSTTATAASPAGSYAIAVSGAADPNYAITFVSGTLTITPAPSPPPPPPHPRGFTAQLVTLKVGKKKRLGIRVSFTDTGATERQFTSPFQKPAFKNIRVSVSDSNGDGVPDLVVVTAKKGKKTVTATFPG
jgi:hypothetical protein